MIKRVLADNFDTKVDSVEDRSIKEGGSGGDSVLIQWAPVDRTEDIVERKALMQWAPVERTESCSVEEQVTQVERTESHSGEDTEGTSREDSGGNSFDTDSSNGEEREGSGVDVF